MLNRGYKGDYTKLLWIKTKYNGNSDYIYFYDMIQFFFFWHIMADSMVLFILSIIESVLKIWSHPLIEI